MLDVALKLLGEISDKGYQAYIVGGFVRDYILGIDSNATDDEIKKAYREMAKKYHPDKVAYLGEDVRKSAEQKLQEVNEAFEK